MRTFKIALAALMALTLVASCGEDKVVSRQDYDNLAKDYEELKIGNEKVYAAYDGSFQYLLKEGEKTFSGKLYDKDQNMPSPNMPL